MSTCSRRPAARAPVVPYRCRSFRRRALPLLACAVVTASGQAASQPVAPGASRLDPVAVTATRQSQPIADVLADLTVIGPEEIARAGVLSLTELLQRQPGVEIVQNGGPGSVSGVFLRGANRGQTLVLIDGVRMSSSSAGATTLEAIPLDQVERIEVLRGPASSLYGADAIGGVIQVFTRQGGGALSGNASAGYGTYNTWDVKGGVAGSAGPVTFAVQAAAKESNGFNTITDPANYFYNPDTDGYTNQSVSASAGVTFAPGQEARAQYFRSRLNNQFDGSHTDYDDRTITIAEMWQVQSRNRLASFWVSLLTAAQGIDDSRTQTADGSFPFKTTQTQYTWQNEFALPMGALTAGYERREERVSTDLAFATTSRNTDSVFGIYQLRFDAQAVQANLRYDESSQYGGETTGAIVYSYRPTPAWRLTAGYSTGFKAPSFNDLYYPNFANPESRAGDVAQCRRWRLLDRCRGRRERRDPGDCLSQPDPRADRVPVRCRLQLRAAERGPRHARRRHARRRPAHRRRRHGGGIARRAIAAGRPHRQAAAAACAAARRAGRGLPDRARPSRPRSHRVVAALR